MSKTFSCLSCAKLFKTSASLASHKYRIHPYSAKTKRATKIIDDDLSSLKSNLSATSSLSNAPNIELETKIGDNKSEIQLLDWAFNSLKKRVEGLESSNHSQELDTIKQKGGATQIDHDHVKISDAIKEFRELKFQSDLNTSKIELLKRQMQEMKERRDESDLDSTSVSSDEVDDIIDEVMGLADLFTAGNFESLKADIKSLRQTISMLLRSNIGKEVLSSEELSLLEEMSQTSKHQIVMLMRNNFSRLEKMFRKLKSKIDNAYEDEYIDEENHDFQNQTEDANSEEKYINEESKDEQSDDKSENDGNHSESDSNQSESDGNQSESDGDKSDDNQSVKENEDSADDEDFDERNSFGFKIPTSFENESD